MAPTRKLIEVALPLQKINDASALEKSVPRKGHPATMHLWWARRPLATARAMLFAQLVDDPSSHPEAFPTHEAQRAERERLHDLVADLAKWENTRNDSLLKQAHAEILKSTGGNPPPILDPFAGGGTIPLEAQRLGLEAHASDLNPVAVLINKALIEFPPKFRDQPPVAPGLACTRSSWRGAEGLAADVRHYGEWMRDRAKERIGHLYPDAILPDGPTVTVIAWIWARTVSCPNPACGIEMPLVRSWWLGKKKGKEAYTVPVIVDDHSHPSGKRVTYRIGHDPSGPTIDGTMSRRRGGVCVNCGTAADMEHLKAEGLAGRMGAQLMAVVAEGNRRRVYIEPTNEHLTASAVERPEDIPSQELGFDPRNLWTPAYGLTRFSDLFTSRQLVALTTFSDLVGEARELVLADALAAIGTTDPGPRLADGGSGAAAFADVIATYLSFPISKLADWSSSICSWIPQIESVTHTFARQAIPMAWDYTEINPFSNSVGNFGSHVDWVSLGVESLPSTGPLATVEQDDAVSAPLSGGIIATDPPYYDNIAYSDLSDFFYVWLRRSLQGLHPSLLGTLLVPKADELVASPYRRNGKEGAEQFFEAGFREVFSRARAQANPEYPTCVYYAFKQSDSASGERLSKGWEKFLQGLVASGWRIVATWPVRSEKTGRMISVGTNALASSIVLALRPRPENAPTTDRRGFLAALRAELPDALRALQMGAIQPVDLPQVAIGPGMAVFSRYSRVMESDGSSMTVRSALARINEILDEVLSEQEGDFDATSRFAIAWYRQHGYTTGKFGDADNIARARNSAVETLARDGLLSSAAGKVTLLKPAEYPANYDVLRDDHTSSWEALHHAIRLLETQGVGEAAVFLSAAKSRPDGAVEPDMIKELAFLLFSIAEKNGWTKDALSFNALATIWPDVVVAATPGRAPTVQASFDFDEEN